MIADETGILRKVRSASELEGLLTEGLTTATPGVIATRDTRWYVRDGIVWSSAWPEQVHAPL